MWKLEINAPDANNIQNPARHIYKGTKKHTHIITRNNQYWYK